MSEYSPQKSPLSVLPQEGEQPNRYDLPAAVWSEIQFSSACILVPDTTTAVVAYRPSIPGELFTISSGVILPPAGGAARSVWYCRPGQVIVLPAPGRWKFFASAAVRLEEG